MSQSDSELYAEIKRQLAVKRRRTETQVRNELRALLASAQERIDEGYYGIAESCLKQALACLDEASGIKLSKRTPIVDPRIDHNPLPDVSRMTDAEYDALKRGKP